MTTAQTQPQIRKAGCKINLSLKITGRREDGYHLLDSIFWPLAEPHDTLEFYINAPTETEHAFTVHCTTKGIDLTNNTLTKAYAAFVCEGGVLQDTIKHVHVDLQKGIPHGAGLGGGSSDAATVLHWCNEHAKTPLSTERLHAAALRVGADVPFFLENVPARVQGIGEIITPLALEEKKAFQGHVLLLCPDVMISTPWAYKTWDEKKSELFLKNKLTKSNHDDKPVFGCAGKENAKVENDFEEVVFQKHPELAKLKHDLLDQGAQLATMSGSGSSIVGIVSSRVEAEAMAKYFFHAQCKVFLTTL